MIITVFVSTHSAQDQWRAELLEHSWIQAGQSGELVRLVACPPSAPLPMHIKARVVRTLPYDPHPFLQDHFPGYNLPAALLEWLVTERVDASLLLLDLDSVLRKSFDEEIAPGGATGNRWEAWPAGSAAESEPFGLKKNYSKLQEYCVNRKLKPPRVEFPMLIHSSDLLKMAARWLELTGLIRTGVSSKSGSTPDAHKVAYSLAAAEYRIPHRALKLAVGTADKKANTAVLSYNQPVKSERGKVLWDCASYQPWSHADVTTARAGAGRSFLTFLNSYVTLRETGKLLNTRRPRRCFGVREARLPDRMLLEIPGVEAPMNLNASASAIWNLCDNQRTMANIADELKKQFDVPRDVLCDDIDRAIIQLHTGGALDLDIVLTGTK